ncbi:MAG: sodium/solute symporter [Lentisphaeria bacterium]|nr:sodium/solute symporter [Lentisphaeria bacterium]
MLGASISSITFLALPAAAYILDWRQLVPNLTMPAVAILAAIFIIPFFRQTKATSAFEYLEKRYGMPIRIYAAFSFLIMLLLRLALVLYLVAIPMAELLGCHIFTVIIVVGVITSFYTIVGGLKAVVWTDVIQTIILLGGGILIFVLIALALPGGFGQIISEGMADNKFSLGPMTWGLSDRSFFVMFLMGLVNFGTEYSSNQGLVQRYVASKTTKEARRATLICAFMSIPTWCAFYFVGTSLYVYYKIFPDTAVAALESDAVLPYFILHRIPTGLSGVIIAACLAAAMSTLSSVINSCSTVCTVDFLQRFWKRSDASALKWAKFFSLAASVIMILGACAIDYVEKESINDMSLIIGSVFGGGMLALYMSGFFTKRIGRRAITIGLLTGILFNVYMMCNSFHWLPDCLTLPIHSYWTTILVNLLIIIASLIVSLFDKNKKPLPGLTFWTKQQSDND